MPTFAQHLIDWHRQHGRHDLPWQGTCDPYRVWLSEIMLQQTQVGTVIPYYARFLARFPTLADLAGAPVEDVMALWSGLGYYARARNLHRCAQDIVAAHAGHFPRSPAEIARLPGIGQSTAHAIAVFCFGARAAILDGNVKRLLCRCFGIAGTGTKVDQRLWQQAESLLPKQQVATYIQAQMDMGATICTRTKPRCTACPVATLCVAFAENRVGELPTPKPRGTLPQQAVVLLVIRHGERVLLEQRPPTGIWGGLLSLPELPEGEDAAKHCAQHLRLPIGAVSPAPTFQHSFTHFRLSIQPLICETRSKGKPPADYRWLDRKDWAGAALPTPIRKVLNAL
ncbi:MAG: A/G-specific adenine glycosylase [Rhodocyclaceae bacterium]|nr:A/G-specific adenine glycosylase [Rhodocyclaceae bacterium]MDZ4215922.1 A/G-specific adenine glycosylase [Rhodocyclaceae bacterium]